MKRIYSMLLMATIASLCSFTVLGQDNDTLETQRNDNGKISFARFKPNANRKLQDGGSFLKKILQTNPDDSLQIVKETIDEFGFTHRRFQQYYKGIKVEEAQYLIQGKNGIIDMIHGDFQNISIPSVKPSLTEAQGVTKALGFVNAKKYKWEDPAMEMFVKKNTNNPNATYYPKGELVIAKDILTGSNAFKLAWKFTISSLLPNNEQLIFVDATTGSVIRNIPLILDVNTPCTAQTLYSGVLGITGDSFNGGFRLQENRNGVTVQTLNLNNTYNYPAAVDFVNGNTNFTVANWPNFNRDQQALDAHWSAENILDYWRNVFNRNSIDGNGIRMLGYVHAGSVWDNAQWVAGANNHFMQYGDGDGVTWRPLVSLDVCAHEIGHGIDEFTANLTPGTAESGALNEGFSDIWGASVEHWAAPNKQTWLMGEELFFGGVFSCVRNLQNPKTTTAAEGQHPDTYHGLFWSSAGEPHFNSTVLSHWFFILSQGLSGTNDNGNAFNVLGIGIDAAQRIAYNTELLLTPASTYANARTMSIQAARNMNGGAIGSCQEIAVTNAWYAVGVGAAYPALTINGDNYFCGATSNLYTLNNLPSNATIAWSVTPSGLGQINTPNATTTTITKLNNGPINLTATASCGVNQNYVVTKPVSIGGPSVGINYNTSGGCRGSIQTWSLAATPSSNGTNWNWSVSYLGTNSSIYIYNPTSPSTFADVVGGGTVTLKYKDLCGVAQTNGVTLYSFCHASPLIAPNPASGVVTVSTSNSNQIKSNDASSSLPQWKIYQIKVLNQSGNVMKVFKYPSGVATTNIDLTNLVNGTYTLQIFDNFSWVSQQIVIVK